MMASISMPHPTPSMTRKRVVLISAATAGCVIGILLYRNFFRPHRTLDEIEARSINTLEGAISQFKTDCGRFPMTSEGLQALITAPANTPTWHGPYLPHFPHDRWNRPYVYRCPSSKYPQGFLVLSTGPDGIERTDDDVSNESINEIIEEQGRRLSAASSFRPDPRPLENPQTGETFPRRFVIYSFGFVIDSNFDFRLPRAGRRVIRISRVIRCLLPRLLFRPDQLSGAA